jgi:hypothetical protein
MKVSHGHSATLLRAADWTYRTASQADSRQLGTARLAPLPQVLHDALVINDADIATHTDPVGRGRAKHHSPGPHPARDAWQV